MSKDNPAADPESDAFPPLSGDPAPQPQPVEDGELVHDVSDHEHNYQRFRQPGSQESTEMCSVCLRKKGSRS